MEGVQVRRIETGEELEQAFAIRREVFVREQRIPADEDFDDKDDVARHVLVSIGGRAAATGRVLVSDPEHAVLARIAVLEEFRGSGLGPVVVRELEAIATAAGCRHLSLHPHHYLERFYADLGYVTVPGSESEVGVHRLITMAKTIGPEEADR
jgi:predicted GNAT family N-acyltransferase